MQKQPPEQVLRKSPSEQNHNHTAANNFTGAITESLHALRQTKQILKQFEGNKTYNKKYKGLPEGTPVPVIGPEYSGDWDVWEWWAGEAGISHACKHEGLRVGPPISHQYGWCLKIKSHRQALWVAHEAESSCFIRRTDMLMLVHQQHNDGVEGADSHQRT